MSNEYFNKPADIEPRTRALHTSVNTLSQATDQGFDAIPTNLSGLKSEVEAARDGEASLLAKEQAQDTATQTVTSEVEAARDGEASLLEKEQVQDNEIVALKSQVSIGEKNNYYFPDPLEVDQGVNGNGFSIKDCIDSIGSKKATIFLKHNSISDTTIYTVSTDLTIPENICFIIENGAIVSVDSGKVLTINGAFEAGLYQVFSGDGSVYFGDNSVDDVYPEWWGAVADCVTEQKPFDPAVHYGGHPSNYDGEITTYVSGTDSKTAIQKAINSLSDRMSLKFSKGMYYISPNYTNQDRFYSVCIISDKHNIKIFGDQTKIFCYQDITTYSMNLIRFLGCTNIEICGLDLNYQGGGFPNYDINGSLTQMSLFSFFSLNGPQEFSSLAEVIFSQESKNNKIYNCSFRINHPGGAYPGAANSTYIGSGKVMGILFYGDYVSPDSYGDKPPSNLSLTKYCSFYNNTFKESQGRLVWSWMTYGIIIKDNKFLDTSGGQRPSIRCLHYNGSITIENNYIEAGNNWLDDDHHEPAILVSANEGKYYSEKVSICNNSIITERGAGIAGNGFLNSNINNNIIKGRDNYISPSTSYVFAGIWLNGTDIEKGIIKNCKIANNLISNKEVGIAVKAICNVNITENKICNCHTDTNAAIEAWGIEDTFICNNYIDTAYRGILFFAPSDPWGGTVLIGNNIILNTINRGIDYSKGSSTFKYPVIKNNYIENCDISMRVSPFLENNISVIPITGHLDDDSDAIVKEYQNGVFGISTNSSVIEYGTTVTGTFLKFADGTLICYIKEFEIAFDNNSIIDSQWSFPYIFSDTDISIFAILAYGIGTSSLRWNKCLVSAAVPNIYTANVAVRAYDDSVSSDHVFVNIIAIGRWK